jgi:hypothetical protein
MSGRISFGTISVISSISIIIIIISITSSIIITSSVISISIIISRYILLLVDFYIYERSLQIGQNPNLGVLVFADF